MKYLKIKNWDRWQTYRSDRSQPPWIKVHRSLMRDIEWHQLSDSQKGQLVSIWMLAADKGGEIPSDPDIIKKFCGLEEDVDLQAFISLGFIEHDASMTPDGRQDDAKETTQTRLDQTRSDQTRQDQTSAKPDGRVNNPTISAMATQVLDYLCEVTGRRFQNKNNIYKCIRKENCTVVDCKLVIDFKWSEWAGSDMQKNVNAVTLWRPAHFANYLDEAKAGEGHKVPQKRSQGRYNVAENNLQAGVNVLKEIGYDGELRESVDRRRRAEERANERGENQRLLDGIGGD